MFKVFFRSLVILLIVAIVGGGIYALVQNTSIGTSFGERDFGGRVFTGLPSATASSATISAQTISTVRFRDRGENRFSFSLGRGLTGILGDGISIVAITLVVFLLRKVMAPRTLRARPASID